MATTEVQHTETAVSEWKREPTDAPSARFGWHGDSPMVWRVVMGLAAFGCLVLLIGNHKGQVENIYVIGFAAACLLWIARSIIVNRGKWKN